MNREILKFYVKELLFKWNDIRSSSLTCKRDLEHHLRLNGYYVIDNFISDEDCENYRKLIDRNLDNPFVWSDEFNSDVRIFGIENIEASFHEIFDREGLINIYKKYISIKSFYQTIMAAKMMFSPLNLGSGGGWHRDTVNQRQLKFIVYLSDVDGDNGCFQYVKGSHTVRMKLKTGAILKGNYLKQRYSSQEVDRIAEMLDLPVVDFHGTKGTLIVVDTSGLHRGKPMRNGVRYAVTSYMSEVPFGPSVSKLIAR